MNKARKSTSSRLMDFEEDNFDLTAHKKAADTVTKEKARVKVIRRQVAFGKAVMAVSAFLIFILLFIIAYAAGFIVI